MRTKLTIGLCALLLAGCCSQSALPVLVKAAPVVLPLLL